MYQIFKRGNTRSIVLFFLIALAICWLRCFAFLPEERNSFRYYDYNMIKSVCRMYQINNGFYPTTEQGLQALITKPNTEPLPQHWTQLADAIPIDPWSKEYRYRCDDPYSKEDNAIQITSAGKDGMWGSEDDVVLGKKPTPLTLRQHLQKLLPF